jgi:hypothetical protein
VADMDDILDLNKQALFALKFQRTPEEMIVINSENPNLETFKINSNIRNKGLAKFIENSIQLNISENYNSPKNKQLLGFEGTQIANNMFSFNLDNNLSEILNYQLPDGSSIMDIIINLHSTEKITRELASRLLFQMLIESDDLKYPWFSLNKKYRDRSYSISDPKIQDSEYQLLWEIMKEKNSILEEKREKQTNYRKKNNLSNPNSKKLKKLIYNYGDLDHKLRTIFSEEMFLTESPEEVKPFVFFNNKFLQLISTLSSEPEKKPYGSNLLDL